MIPAGLQAKIKAITGAKTTEERAWLSEVASVALVQSVRDAHRAHSNFLDSIKGRLGAGSCSFVAVNHLLKIGHGQGEIPCRRRLARLKVGCLGPLRLELADQ